VHLICAAGWHYDLLCKVGSMRLVSTQHQHPFLNCKPSSKDASWRVVLWQGLSQQSRIASPLQDGIVPLPLQMQHGVLDLFAAGYCSRILHDGVFHVAHRPGLHCDLASFVCI